jgi:hypothetical protein
MKSIAQANFILANKNLDPFQEYLEFIKSVVT